MKKSSAVLIGIATFAALPVLAHDGGNRFGGNLDGYQEVAVAPQPSTISTTEPAKRSPCFYPCAPSPSWATAVATTT